MEITTIKGETRQPGSRNANARLRKSGLLPAVIYGHQLPPETVAVSQHDLELALQHNQQVVKLLVDGKETQYLIKEVQYDHLDEKPLHVDLVRVNADERVRVTVAIEFRGDPVGLQAGGTLTQVQSEVEVECSLLNIPERLRVRVQHLNLNESVFVRDLEVPEGVQVLDEPTTLLAIVHPPRGTTEEEIAAAVEGEGSAEPEVIKKGKEEDADAGA
ncbi:MAG: 50S ribosomal protein L25 [Phycisphaerales bacterium]|nr:50S ribosomal protein L25 [Phycisphaerales bacterium]